MTIKWAECPNCGSENIKRQQDYRISSDEQIQVIVHCGECDLEYREVYGISHKEMDKLEAASPSLPRGDGRSKTYLAKPPDEG